MTEPPPQGAPPQGAPLREGEDYYVEHGLLVFTAAHHRRRGYCCGSRCRHCPYPVRVQEATVAWRQSGHRVDSISDMRSAVEAAARLTERDADPT